MIMESFSIDRMGHVMTKEIRENWRNLLMMLGVMLGTMTLAAILCAQSSINSTRDCDPAIGGEVVAFTLLFFAFGAISASMMFRNMNSKESRLATLMNPASQLEKYIARWLIFIPGFVAVYFLFGYVADFVRYIIYVGIIPTDIHPVELIRLSDMFEPGSNEEWNVVLMIFCIIQSFYALGSSVWPRNSLIKTFIALALIGIAYIFIGIWTADLMVDDEVRTGRAFHCDNDISPLWLWVPTVIVCLINYTVAYFRFRESEIIERW